MKKLSFLISLWVLLCFSSCMSHFTVEERKKIAIEQQRKNYVREMQEKKKAQEDINNSTSRYNSYSRTSQQRSNGRIYQGGLYQKNTQQNRTTAPTHISTKNATSPRR